jgi:hypothetical protein
MPLRSVHTISFHPLLDELGASLLEPFAVQVVPGRRYPDLVYDGQKLLDDTFVLTDEALSDVPALMRTLVEGAVRVPVRNAGCAKTSG